jgi:hypothetical protein
LFLGQISLQIDRFPRSHGGFIARLSPKLLQSLIASTFCFRPKVKLVELKGTNRSQVEMQRAFRCRSFPSDSWWWPSLPFSPAVAIDAR